jgi:hypothetical protein
LTRFVAASGSQPKSPINKLLIAVSYAPQKYVAEYWEYKMLDRVSSLDDLLERRTQSAHNGQHRLRNSRSNLKDLTARFRNALRKGVEGIIEAGQVLIEAKQVLDHGHFTDWVVDVLKWGERRPGKNEANLRKAEMCMYLARHPVIGDPRYFDAFPPSPRTLWELTQIRPKQRLIDLIADGTINSGMTVEEAAALRRGLISHGHSPTPKLKREIAALLDVCILLGGGDGVLAHIHGLKRVNDAFPVKDFERAARWAKQKLAERRVK